MPVLLLLVAIGCGGGSADETASYAVGEQDVATDGGTWTVHWSPSPDPIPLNEVFSIDATVLDGSGAPVVDASLVANAGMGSHGHGMNTVPETTAGGDGTFLVEGMLFHMTGAWQITFDITHGDTLERATAEVSCCAAP